jgi:hypothetical protein
MNSSTQCHVQQADAADTTGAEGREAQATSMSRTLQRNEEKTAPTTHQAAAALCCHNRTAVTTAETVHLVCTTGTTGRGGNSTMVAHSGTMLQLPAS